MAIKALAPEAPPVPSAPPAMEVDAEAVWTASPGMSISTIHVTRTQHAYVAVEHPEGMTRAQVLGGLKDRALDFAPSVCWWETETQTDWAEIALGTNAPHDKSAEPFPLIVSTPE
jgi:hypothetical protein